MQKTLLQRATALLTAAALTTTAAFAQAPTFEWGKSFGSTSNETANNITTDMAGNSYIIGQFSGTVDFNPSAATFELDAANGNQFLVKFAANGDFIWAKQSAFAISALEYANGHLYLSNSFNGAIDVDFSAATTNITSLGDNDVFVAKLDTAASLVWAKTIGNATNDGFNTFKVKGDGSFYLATNFVGTLDTDPSAATNNLTTAGAASEVQISYFDANGDFVWAKQLTEDIYITSLAHNNNELYAAGSISDTIALPDGITVTPTRSAEFVLLKVNTSNQTIAWAKSFGKLDEEAIAVYVKNGNPVLVSTHFGSGVTIDYDPSASTNNITHTGSYEGIFVEFNPNGNFVSANVLQNANAADRNFITSITSDDQGNVYASGILRGTTDFNPGSGTSNATAISSAFILKLNSTQALEFVEISDSGTINLKQLHVNNTGNIYAVGTIANTCDLDITAGTNYATAIGLGGNAFSDAFVFKLDQPTFVSVSRQAENTTPIRLFPNPAANFINIENAPIGSQLRIVDALGRTALSQIISNEYSQIATDALSNGVYFFQFHINGEATATQKIIIAK